MYISHKKQTIEGKNKTYYSLMVSESKRDCILPFILICQPLRSNIDNHKVKGTGYPDPEAECHFDIRKMSAISHILEEKQGSNAAQNSMIAQFFIERFVQFRSARFKGSLHVRPGTLWTYVLNPSRRTCKHPLNVRPQSQGRTSIVFFAGEIDVL